MRIIFAVIVSLVLTLHAAAQAPAARPLHTINIITFGGGYNIPAWIAQRQGFFAKHGVAVNLTYTPDSVYLMTNLIDGKFDVALTSIDNLIAYQEGQGEAPVKTPPAWLLLWAWTMRSFISSPRRRLKRLLICAARKCRSTQCRRALRLSCER